MFPSSFETFGDKFLCLDIKASRVEISGPKQVFAYEAHMPNSVAV
jgi:hypothetical protein